MTNNLFNQNCFSLKHLLPRLRSLVLNGRSSDAIWNLLSFFIFGLSVTGTSLVFSRFYTAQEFGLFNLGFTIWMIVAQILGGGVQFSVLTRVAQSANDRVKQHQQLLSGMIAVLCWSLFLSILVSCLEAVTTDNFVNSYYEEVFLLVLPAGLALSLNKVMLSYCNAAERLKVYAVFSALRGVLLFTIALTFILLNVPGKLLPLALSLAEVTTFLLLSGHLIIGEHIVPSRTPLQLIRGHFSFGLRAMPGALVIDLNTRVDVIMLSALSTPAAVGIYSFAAVFIDGLMQLGIVARTLTNPKISEAYTRKDFVQLHQLFLSTRRTTYTGIGIIGLLLAVFYPLLIHFGGYQDYLTSLPTFFVLLCCVIGTCGYLPFLMVLNQTGRPFLQTLLYTAICVINISGNLLFIPLFQEVGAAIGTGLAIGASAFAIDLIFRRLSPMGPNRAAI